MSVTHLIARRDLAASIRRQLEQLWAQTEQARKDARGEELRAAVRRHTPNEPEAA